MVAKSKSDVDNATAGAAGAAVSADQQTAGAGATTRDFSEVGHKASTDVNTEESISTYNQLAVNRALRNMEVWDNMAQQVAQNAIETANLLSKQTLRQMFNDQNLATDRMWNVNETDAYSVQAIKAVADILKGE